MKKYYPDYDNNVTPDRKWIEQNRDLTNGARYGSQKPVTGSNLKRYQRKSDMDYPTRADMMSRTVDKQPNRRNVPPAFYSDLYRYLDNEYMNPKR